MHKKAFKKSRKKYLTYLYFFITLNNSHKISKFFEKLNILIDDLDGTE